MTVANTILQQLGGRAFVAMTGARNLLDCGNSLRFNLPRNFAKGGIDSIRVTLDADDTYTVAFWSSRQRAHQSTKEFSNVYAEDLAPLFSDQTGLCTIMPRIFTRRAA